MPSDGVAIHVAALRKSYGARVAVDGIDLDVMAGETLGLLGPNGAGKTTTMSLMAGMLTPDAGILNMACCGPPRRFAARKKIGLAPQALALYGELTAEENLSFFAQLYGLRGAHLRNRVAWGLDLANLNARRNDRVNAFSGGMKRRLNIACAAVHDPAVLLLDEPTVGVDPQSRNHIFESIEALKATGSTVLYSTHYMEEAERLCDRIAIIDRGKILAIDSLPRLIAQHGGDSVVEGELEQEPDNPAALPFQVCGTSFRWSTEEPFEKLAEIGAMGIKLRALHVYRADLESVFLNLTGRSLRD